MEEGAQVWLRSSTSQWGWLPALLQNKSHTTDDKTGEDMTLLTFTNDPSILPTSTNTNSSTSTNDDVDGNDEFECTISLPSTVLQQSTELADVKMRNVDSSNNSAAFTRSPSIVLHKMNSSDSSNTVAVAGGVDDLIELMHLHEPAILHSLRLRYNQNVIYTSTGPILIAINPFKAMPDLYSKLGMDQYRQQGEALTYGSNASSKTNDPPDSSESKGLLTPTKSPSTATTTTTSSFNSGKKLPPHVYLTADNAYRAMLRGIEDMRLSTANVTVKANDQSSNIDQSILVSGESGAGKTVTTKIVLNYFAVLSRRLVVHQANADNALEVLDLHMPNTSHTNTSLAAVAADVGIEQQVLQSNPILEAFGNARTIRNDNSSRFGKFIEVRFDATGRVVGGSIESYLLEKVRLIRPSRGERNYHVFYQLLCAVHTRLKNANATSITDDKHAFTLDDIREWRLDQTHTKVSGSNSTVSQLFDRFKLLSQTGVYDRRDQISDESSHWEMLSAMQIMHFAPEIQSQLMRMVSAVLWAGNVTFTNVIIDGSEGSKMVRDEASMNLTALLGVQFQDLERALTQKKLYAHREIVIKPLIPDQALKALHALVQSLYGAMFDYIVMLINDSIDTANNRSNGTGGSLRGRLNKQEAFIGVLDIFGFEVFDVNNYEQLCINYTNETLQQQFNKYVFKLEQQEYEREGILWKFIPFPDNADVIKLIDSRRPPGILALLDEQCMLPRSTDDQLYRYLCQKFEKNGGLMKQKSVDNMDDTSSNRFQVFPLQRSRNKFSIRHYAGLVEYHVNSWLEKNRDELPLSASELLSTDLCKFELVQNIQMFLRLQSSKSIGSVALPSVGAQFAQQLGTLRRRIDATAPHYIRCLKPNDELVPNEFHPKNVVEQLRYGGVLEAVRVSRAGYPTRYTHDGFMARYYILLDNRKAGQKIELEELVKDITLQVWRLTHPIEANASDKISQSRPNDNKRGGWLTRLSSRNIKFNTNNSDSSSLNLSLSGIAAPSTLKEFLSLDFSARCAVAGFQVGKSKVFLRKEAFDQIESLRTTRFYRAARYIQARVRCNQAVKSYAAALASVKLMQCAGRRYLAVKIVQRKRHIYHVTKIQSLVRQRSSRRKFKVHRFKILRNILRIQRGWRGYKLQRLIVVDHAAAGVIQRYYAAYIARVSLKKQRKAAALVQSTYRGSTQRRKYKQEVQRQAQAKQAEELLLQEELKRTRNRLEAEALARREKLEREQREIESIRQLAAELKLLETARVELWRSIAAQNWSMVEHIVSTTPQVVQAIEPSSGMIVLHSLAQYPTVWPLLIDLCIVHYPKGVLHRDKLGSLPLHHACAHDNIAACEILYNAYTQALLEADNKGRLPIHVTSEFDAVDCTKFILEKAPDTATIYSSIPSKSDKNNSSKAYTKQLPLHFATRYGASIGVITSLLSENFQASKKEDGNGDLPLHLLLRNGSTVEAVCVKTLLTCYNTAVSRADVNGDLPLLLSIKHGCKSSVFNLLLLQFPSAAQVLDSDQHTALFLALVHGADDRTVLSLLNHAPEYAVAVDKETGLLPIQVATEYNHSGLVVHSLLKRDMPIELREKVQAQLLPHHYSWNHILSHTQDLYHAVVTKVLASCTQPQVLALAHVEGTDGSIALATATPVCKHEIRVMLRLFHTLEIVNQRPAYTNPLSDTQIFYALRYNPPSSNSPDQNNKFQVLHEDLGDNRMSNDTESVDSNMSRISARSHRSVMSMRSQFSVEEKLRRITREKGQQVIAKLTSRSDVVERELRIRKNYRLSRNYIPVVFSVHHTVQHAAYSEAMAEPGYCITMEGASATAENYMLDMRNSGVAFSIKDLRKIGIALLHMHEKGLVHGDFGTHNIGKFGKGKWKLLGVGGSYIVTDTNSLTDPRRGFYHPPEAIDLEKAVKDASKRKGLFGRTSSSSHGQNHGSNPVAINCVKSIVAHPTLDIWAYGNVVYEAFVGAPLSPFICRGKRPMAANEYAKLGKWSDSRLKKSLDQMSEANQFRDEQEIHLAKDLLSKIFTCKPQQRLQTMRIVLEHDLFASVRSSKRTPQAGDYTR